MASQHSFDSGFLSERERDIGQLERSHIITKFYAKKKPEKKMLAVRRETMLVVWYRALSARNRFEGAVDVREIKEVRATKCSRDFDRWSADAQALKSPSTRSFVVYYGSHFNLKTLSVVAISDEECQLWVRGLHYLVEDVQKASFRLHQERWFRKGFYEMETPGKEGTIGLSDLKKFMQKVNYKVTTSSLKEKFAKYDTNSTGEIGFDDFCSILQCLLFHRTLFKDTFGLYSKDAKRVTLTEFCSFLLQKQDNDKKKIEAAEVMRSFLQDSSRDVEEPYFTISEFLDWLFSRNNQLFDFETHGHVSQDMTRPMGHYWISSSHNSYLTGDQISSESSVEAYARCLRMGCRSVELDCWDGPEGMPGGPLIYHGHTLTSKIRFLDVVKAIKEHAFVTSDAPVILSIEDNCSLAQQRKMASTFQEVFGDMLVSAPVDTKNETCLPSPEKLKRKIILKHKKLPEGVDENTRLVVQPQNEFDIASSVKNGILYVQDVEELDWKPHFFVLTDNKMYYSEMPSQEEQENDDDDDEEEEEDREETRQIDNSTRRNAADSQMDQSELHFSEPWFHRIVQHGRSVAVDLLKQNAHLGDGTFLVRPSETFVGAYSLSFLRKSEVHHVPIKDRQLDNGTVRYYLIDQVFFDSLYSLITHYQTHPLRSSKFTITLGKPVPPPNQHEGKPWFHAHCSRQQAEQMLARLSMEGAFLVRIGERVAGSFAITFRAEKKIKHCLIKQEGRLFVIGTAQFESLVDLINYYETRPLYKKVCLKVPVNEELLSRAANGADVDSIHHDSEYVPISHVSEVKVRALYDYQARMDDELTLVKNCAVVNVNKKDVDWWKGDYGGKIQHWFPANHVVEIEATSDVEDANNDLAPLGNLQKGSIDIVGAKVEIQANPNRPIGVSGLEYVIRIESPATFPPFEVAAPTQTEALEWANKIRETSQSASHREDENRKKERAMRIARELSNLVVYCRSVVFNMEKHQRREPRVHQEMSSFSETKAAKVMLSSVENCQTLLWYHQVQLSRIYPKAQRVDSSNYNPMPMWNVGSQMAALNFQTGDKAMQLNQAKFMQNGSCGFVLRPDFMFRPDYNPQDPSTLPENLSIILGVQVLGARYLSRKSVRGMVSPYVEVEICGADYDNAKYKTKTIADNGFNPMWDEFFDFDVLNPDLALLRFVVFDVDMFGESNFIGQYTLPVRCIRPGYRSIPLKNAFSEELELSALLVHVTIKGKEESQELLQELSETAHKLEKESELSEAIGDQNKAEELHQEAQKKEHALMRLLNNK